MNAMIYYSVQFAMSEYMLLWEKGSYREIVDRTFDTSEEISVSYCGYGAANGREEVYAFFENLEKDAVQNGSILRNDLPESQYISVSNDGMLATGLWITMTGIIEGPAFGNAKPPYPYKYYIGKYENKFVPTSDGRWAIKSINWKPIIAVGDWAMNPKTGIGLFYTQPEKWPTPMHRRPIDPVTDIITETKCEIRTEIMKFAHNFTKKGVAAITEKIFSEEAGRHAREMLDGTRKGFKGALMLTSPIISFDEGNNVARVFLNTLHIKPYGDRVTSNKGRISIVSEKVSDHWYFQAFDWQCYCTLNPWVVSEFWEENL